MIGIGMNNWLCPRLVLVRRLPGWVERALRQAQRQAGPGQLGIVVLREAGRVGSVVIMGATDFQERFGYGLDGGPTDEERAAPAPELPER